MRGGTFATAAADIGVPRARARTHATTNLTHSQRRLWSRIIPTQSARARFVSVRAHTHTYASHSAAALRSRGSRRGGVEGLRSLVRSLAVTHNWSESLRKQNAFVCDSGAANFARARLALTDASATVANRRGSERGQASCYTPAAPATLRPLKWMGAARKRRPDVLAMHNRVCSKHTATTTARVARRQRFAQLIELHAGVVDVAASRLFAPSTSLHTTTSSLTMGTTHALSKAKEFH